MPSTPDVLISIIQDKRIEVAASKRSVSESELRSRLTDQTEPRGFERRISKRVTNRHRAAVIAECKKASPSKGVIRKNYDVSAIAKSYEAGGAACLSVLTDEKYFHGTADDLLTARNNCSLPILRKDFIVDAYQVYESRSWGADCILLIVSVLDYAELSDFGGLARELGLDVLIEVHSEEELETALRLPFGLIGINNRNLHTFETDLQTSLTLCRQVPPERIVVTESGIHTREDVVTMSECGIRAFLVGESLMKAANPGDKLREIFGPYLQLS